MFKGNLSTEEIELWGHEYVRHLAGEVVQEFNSLPDSAESGTGYRPGVRNSFKSGNCLIGCEGWCLI